TKEAGYPNVRIGHWAGVFAPKGTPQPILDRMNADIIAAVKSQEFHDKLVPSGIEPAPLTLPQYVQFITHERERLGIIARREPLLQLDPPLIAALHARGFEIAVETNGTIAPPDGLDWVCVSPKSDQPLAISRGDELKLVYPQAKALPERFESLYFAHFFLQPM